MDRGPAPSPLTAGDDGGIFKVDESRGADHRLRWSNCARLAIPSAPEAAIGALKAAAPRRQQPDGAEYWCALARVTTGSGPGRCGGLRRIPPHTGIEGQQLGLSGDRVEMLRQRVNALAENMGHRPRIVVGKPGLDGHSNGAEVIAVSARHVGFDVIYSGIQLSPTRSCSRRWRRGRPDRRLGAVRLAHRPGQADPGRVARTRRRDDIALVMGGIIPPADAAELESMGIKRCSLRRTTN